MAHRRGPRRSLFTSGTYLPFNVPEPCCRGRHATTTAAAAAGAPAVATITAATPAPAPPPVYVPTSAPVYNWTGFYTGGNLGFGWNHGSFSDPLGNTLTPTTRGQFLGGGQVGLNYQFWGDVLIDAEADFDWLPNTNISSTALLVNPPGPHGQHRFGYCQQSVANDCNWPPGLRMGPRAPLRKGRRRVGRVK